MWAGHQCCLASHPSPPPVFLALTCYGPGRSRPSWTQWPHLRSWRMSPVGHIRPPPRRWSRFPRCCRRSTSTAWRTGCRSGRAAARPSSGTSRTCCCSPGWWSGSPWSRRDVVRVWKRGKGRGVSESATGIGNWARRQWCGVRDKTMEQGGSLVAVSTFVQAVKFCHSSINTFRFLDGCPWYTQSFLKFSIRNSSIWPSIIWCPVSPWLERRILQRSRRSVLPKKTPLPGIELAPEFRYIRLWGA